MGEGGRTLRYGNGDQRLALPLDVLPKGLEKSWLVVFPVPVCFVSGGRADVCGKHLC